jgi:hypothetical protein
LPEVFQGYANKRRHDRVFQQAVVPLLWQLLAIAAADKIDTRSPVKYNKYLLLKWYFTVRPSSTSFSSSTQKLKNQNFPIPQQL